MSPVKRAYNYMRNLITVCPCWIEPYPEERLRSPDARNSEYTDNK